MSQETPLVIVNVEGGIPDVSTFGSDVNVVVIDWDVLENSDGIYDVEEGTDPVADKIDELRAFLGHVGKDATQAIVAHIASLGMVNR